jgi:uncharacterized membrane protein YccC
LLGPRSVALAVALSVALAIALAVALTLAFALTARSFSLPALSVALVLALTDTGNCAKRRPDSTEHSRQ